MFLSILIKNHDNKFLQVHHLLYMMTTIICKEILNFKPETLFNIGKKYKRTRYI